MEDQSAAILTRVAQSGRVTEDDVNELRAAVWRRDSLPQADADALFEISDRCAIETPAWQTFFVEAIGHYLLHQRQPSGFLDQGGAEWLQERVDREGRIAGPVEMELLVTVLEAAQNAPDFLKSYALDQVERTILADTGRVDEAEAQLLRRLIFAAGGEGAIVVSSAEADMLFRIKDATLNAVNAPGWLQLFVQAVGNHLLAHSDYRPLSIDEATRLEAEMNRNTPSIAGFFARMIPRDQFGRGTLREAFKTLLPGGSDVGLSSENVMTSDEAGWLKTHIAADGHIDDYEKALLTFIVDETGSLPPSLETLRKTA